MTKLIIVLATTLLSLVVSAQVSENRTVSDFSSLKVATGVKVSYTISNSKSVLVETDDTEKLQFIKTEVENGTLKIFIDNSDKNYKGSKKRLNNIHFNILKVTISGPSLNSFKASSSGQIKMENLNASNDLEIGASSSGSISGKFKASTINVDVSSSSKFKGDVDAKLVVLESSSSAEIVISGKADKITANASSSSSCNTKDLVVETAEVKASSSANISVYASKSLDAKVSSSATIFYYGNPTQVFADKSSSGSVSRK
ncbi:MAG: head GIN domain-containing protein [Flavobacterium sp.]